jgi:F-box/leucine-rich repeat protein 5
MVSKFNFKNLKYLNLSGCPNLSTNGLNKFTVFCMNLNAEDLYYCDNIINGPFDGSANGCENIECNKRFCCRNNGSRFE